MNIVLSKKKTESSVQKRICNPFSRIPSSVFGDILSYLPLKTVVQSKIVSKEWKRLISDPEFAKFYFSKSPTGLLLFSKIVGNVLHFVDLRDSSSRYKLFGDMYIPHKAIVGRFLSTKIDLGKSFILSCNGFLCFCETGSSPSYCICNPITRDYIIIPPPRNMGSEKIPEEHWRSEFGFSPKTGEFKVLSLRLCSASVKQTAKIFTLGQRSWRSVELPNGFDPCGTTAFLNGNFHWVSCREMILSFDVGAETFQEFPFPPKFDFGDGTIMSFKYSLGILEECISLSRSNAVMGLTEIWMLKDYGVTESWSRNFVIDDLNFVGRLNVLWFMEDGKKGQKVLFVCDHSTVSYDKVERVCSNLKFDGLWEDVTLVPHVLCLTPLKDVIIFDENSKDGSDAVPPEQRGMFARASRDIRRPHLNRSNQSPMMNYLNNPDMWLPNSFPSGISRLSNVSYNYVAMLLQSDYSPESYCEVDEDILAEMEDRTTGDFVDKSLFNWAQRLGLIMFPRGPPPTSSDLPVHSPAITTGDLPINNGDIQSNDDDISKVDGDSPCD